MLTLAAAYGCKSCLNIASGEPMGLQWDRLHQMHPVIMAVLLAHALYSIYGHFLPNNVTWQMVQIRGKLAFKCVVEHMCCTCCEYL